MRLDDLAAIIEPQLPPNPVVITTGGQDFSLLGCGDHAVYSTLATRFKALGYTVLLDSEVAASNDEILDLFWRKQIEAGVIDDLTDRKPNAGYVRQGFFYEIANRLSGTRSIEAMERAHGLGPPYNMAPKIYYEPKPHKIDLKDTVLVDFSAVSSSVARDRVAEALRMMAGRFRNPPFMQVMHPPWVVINQEQYIESAYLASSIFEYVDMIAACRAWIGSEAGGQSIAAAVRGEHDVYDMDSRPEIVVTSTRQTFNSRGYTYRVADYRTTANDGAPDYWDPGEVGVLRYRNQVKIREFEMHRRRSERSERG